jgi:uncharacterized OB-fold protein
MAAPAGPELDEESRPYWEGLDAERLCIQRCLQCERHRFPAMPGCPSCGGAASEWVDAAGTGRLYSWVTVQQAFSPDFTDEVPYTIATVELDEGCRLLARLESVAEPRIDARLAVCFVHHEGWSEARFTELFP